ncbi:hypothetical protein [Streptomyces sp. NPDC012508]|uniref:hypothetical protein n=1 Tax=Streptomyces sp. NPDC012508 TaxID=3364837 RepID=UPI0036AD6215
MSDNTPTPPVTNMGRQTAGGKVLWHFSMSLDGFVAGPDHSMDWLTGVSPRPGFTEQYVETTGAVLGGRTAGTPIPTPAPSTAATGRDRSSSSRTIPTTRSPPRA